MKKKKRRICLHALNYTNEGEQTISAHIKLSKSIAKTIYLIRLRNRNLKTDVTANYKKSYSTRFDVQNSGQGN